jgi:hypothetical protein
VHPNHLFLQFSVDSLGPQHGHHTCTVTFQPALYHNYHIEERYVCK